MFYEVKKKKTLNWHFSGELLTIHVKTFDPFLQTETSLLPLVPWQNVLVLPIFFVELTSDISCCHATEVVVSFMLCNLSGYGSSNGGYTGDTFVLCPLPSCQGPWLLLGSWYVLFAATFITWRQNVSPSWLIEKPLHYNFRHRYGEERLEGVPKDEQDFSEALTFWSSQTKRTNLTLSPSRRTFSR